MHLSVIQSYHNIYLCTRLGQKRNSTRSITLMVHVHVQLRLVRPSCGKLLLKRNASNLNCRFCTAEVQLNQLLFFVIHEVWSHRIKKTDTGRVIFGGGVHVVREGSGALSTMRTGLYTVITPTSAAFTALPKMHQALYLNWFLSGDLTTHKR